MASIDIIHKNSEKKLTFGAEESLLEALLAQGFAIDHACEGMASCGTCRIVVLEGQDSLPGRNPLEQDMANDRGFADNERLACQIRPCENITFRRPSEK